jgi:sugar phosphate isomerase/epimerase
MDEAKNFGIATGAFDDERDDWDAALAKAARGGWRVLELTAVTEDLLYALISLLGRDEVALNPFERVSLHAPVVFRTSATAVARRLVALPHAWDIVVHPEEYMGEPLLLSLGRRLVFENMDSQTSFGRSVADLGSVFDAHPEAGFCLDVAHCWTSDPSLRLAHDLLDSFGDRLCQLHVSGIEPDGTHRATTRRDLDLYAPVLARCPHVPWLLEAELVEGDQPF